MKLHEQSTEWLEREVRALEESVKHHKRNRDAESWSAVSLSAGDCALCRLHHSECAKSDGNGCSLGGCGEGSLYANVFITRHYRCWDEFRKTEQALIDRLMELADEVRWILDKRKKHEKQQPRVEVTIYNGKEKKAYSFRGVPDIPRIIRETGLGDDVDLVRVESNKEFNSSGGVCGKDVMLFTKKVRSKFGHGWAWRGVCAWWVEDECVTDRYKLEEIAASLSQREYKHISYKKEVNGGIKFVITEQTHRGREFGFNDYFFTACDGFNLASSDTPEGGSDWCFLRGVNHSKDNNPIIAPSAEWADRFEQAIAEYNEYFCGEPECDTVKAPYKDDWWYKDAEGVIDRYGGWTTFKFPIKPATLDDLAVDKGGVKMWAYTDYCGELTITIGEHDQMVFAKSHHRNIAKALWDNNPIIPYEQWKWLQKKEGE